MIPISADGQEVTLSKPSPMEMMGGRYTSEKVLGEGTYGRVLLCYDRQTQRKVAVKVAQENHAYRQSALTEIEVLKSLHEIPTVPRILDTFEDAGRVCIVTELLDRNLYQVLHERRHCPLEVSDIRKVMQHILSALAALHSTGRIHCDVKPENIMLRRPEQPNNIAINNRGSDDNANRWNAVQQSPFIPLGYGNKDWASAGCGIVNSMEDLNGSFARTNTATDRGSQVRIEQEAGPMMQAAIGSPGPFCSDMGCQNRGSHASNLYRADETNSFLSSQGPSTSTYFACNSIGTFPITGAATNTAAVTMAQPTTLPAADFDLTCLIDFGAVRKLHDNRYYDIQSLWYRAPEVLRGIPYSQSIDAWSVGCLLYELYVGRPLFSGNDEQDQFQKIHSRLLPSQSSQNLVSPGAMPADATRGFYGFVTSRRAQAVKRAVQKGFDLSGEWTVGDDLLIALMMDLLQTDETKRVSCSEALRHAFLVTDSTTMGQQLAGLKVRVASTNSMSCVGEMAASGTLRKQNSFSQMISATMPRTFAWPDRSEAGLSTSIPTVPSYPRMDDPNSLHPVNPLLHRITPTTCCTTPTGSSFLPTPTMTKGNMAVSSTTLPPPPLPSDATVFTHATFAQPACCPPQTLVMPAFPPAYPCAESDRQQMAHLQQHGAPVVYPPQLLYVQPHYSALQPQPPQLAQQVTMSQAPVPVQQAQPSHSPMMHFGAVVRTRMCAWGNRRNSHPNPKTGASLRQRIQPQQPLQVQPVSFV